MNGKLARNAASHSRPAGKSNVSFPRRSPISASAPSRASSSMNAKKTGVFTEVDGVMIEEPGEEEELPFRSDEPFIPKMASALSVIADILERGEQVIRDKGDASDLVLDGELMGENPEEMNLFDLLKLAKEDFNEEDHTIDETILRREWPALQARLRLAQTAWDGEPAATKEHKERIEEIVPDSLCSLSSFAATPLPVPVPEPQPSLEPMHSALEATTSLDHLFPNLTMPVPISRGAKSPCVAPSEARAIVPDAPLLKAGSSDPAFVRAARKTVARKSRVAHSGTVAAVFDPFADVDRPIPEPAPICHANVAVAANVEETQAGPPCRADSSRHSRLATAEAPSEGENIIPFPAPVPPAPVGACASTPAPTSWRDRLRRMRLAYA